MENTEKKVLSEKVYQSLLKSIFSGESQSGERIYEEKITKSLGVSRTPVREALFRLSTEGLINIRPNKCVEIISFNQKMIENIGIVRINIDILAALLCIENGRNLDFMELRTIAEECRDKSEKEDIESMIEQDSKFHLKLAEISGNSIVEKMQRELNYKVRLLQLRKFREIAADTQTLKENLLKRADGHFLIVDALYERDPKHIRECVFNHLSPFYNIQKPYDSFFL